MTETSNTSEMDLTLKLLEGGHAKLKVGPDGLDLKVSPTLPTAMVGEVVRSRMNARIISNGFGPKGQRPNPYDALGVRYCSPRPGNPGTPPRPAGPGPAGAPVPRPGNPGGMPPRPAAVPEPAVPVEEIHRVADAECPECVQGKHGNCNGSAWCRAHDALELCPCAQADLEEIHRVAECPECAQGKHGNCDGSAWCQTHDALELCPCAQADHQ